MYISTIYSINSIVFSKLNTLNIIELLITKRAGIFDHR